MSVLLRNLVLFGRVLRVAGIPVTAEQSALLARALADIGLASRADLAHAARAVLVSRREDLALFNELFDLFFRVPGRQRSTRIDLGRALAQAARRRRDARLAAPPGRAAAAGPRREEPPSSVFETRGRPTWSDLETLRHKDFARLNREEEAAVRHLLAGLTLDFAPRASRRRIAASSGPYPDLRRALRRGLATGGEALRLAWRRRKRKPRPLVVLCDVSASMEVYTRLLLPFVYALGRVTRRFEAFAFGTRLTRITRELARRDVHQAVTAAAARVADLGGGTRIGECLRTFNYRWARRLLGQGAVVAVVSDGWDCGDPALLGRETARLARACSRLLWLNPLAGSPGYEPLTRGLAAALPYVDDFRSVRDLASLEELARLLGGAGGRGGGGRPASRAR